MRKLTVNSEALEALIGAETSQAFSSRVSLLAETLSKHSAVQAILFYGSGLWKSEDDDTIYDFYLLIDRYRNYKTNLFLALGGTLVPPNVYYFQTNGHHSPIRCKFAVMTMEQFASAASGRSLTYHIWARFCQPCRMPFVKDKATKKRVINSLANASITFHKSILPLVQSSQISIKDFWLTGLKVTYSCEIRCEKKDRPELIFDSTPKAFTSRTKYIVPDLLRDDKILLPLNKTQKWPLLKLAMQKPLMKLVIFFRLIKAAFTFSGGLSYLQWKIERQSNIRIEINDFQRRHPLLGGVVLFWTILRRGGLK